MFVVIVPRVGPQAVCVHSVCECVFVLWIDLNPVSRKRV